VDRAGGGASGRAAPPGSRRPSPSPSRASAGRR
jgi:hypothetical protein